MNTIIDHTFDNMPANMNRYLLLSVDIDFAWGERTAFVYSKLASFVIVGFIDLSKPKEWQGTKVRVRKGLIGPREYRVPAGFGNYLMERARGISAMYSGISRTQENLIDETMRGNIDRAADSESFRAMSSDVRLFGRDAFKKDTD